MSFCSDASADELQTLGWYHYDLSRHAAEALLLSNGINGSYLLRNSNKGPGCFALSVRAKDSVKHFHVTRKDNGYVFGFNEFATLQDFVNHFANQPLLGSDTGTLIVLKCPYPWRVEEPSIYESVRVHTAIQTGRTENDLVPNAPSLGTKEGYLVKQGAIVKSWKQRWFTLNRHELKYFKDKMCEEPIRTLDLRACSAVQFDYSQDRVNCFCMGDLQHLEQDFYQTGYYIDDQGHTVAHYDSYDSTNLAYYDSGAQAFVSGALDPLMEQQYTGQFYQPAMLSGTVVSPGTDYSEEEPTLLEELGINFDHIWQKTLTVLNPFKPADGSIMNETDLTGPILFWIGLGVTLMMRHPGYSSGLVRNLLV